MLWRTRDAARSRSRHLATQARPQPVASTAPLATEQTFAEQARLLDRAVSAEAFHPTLRRKTLSLLKRAGYS
jgi:hypothetical protein